MKNTKSTHPLYQELLSIHALNPFAAYTSPSRGVMFGSHLTQHIVLSPGCMQERFILGGPEKEMSKYTFGVRMPDDGKIVKVIQKYPPGVSSASLPFNPETLVIFHNLRTNEYDCFTIPYHRSFHPYFGWPCVPTDNYDLLKQNQPIIPKDTVFADSPGVADGNSYMWGRNVPVCFLPLPSVAEDGFIIARSELENFRFKIYQERLISWGERSFPVEIYGPGKCFPDIGSYIREDGLVMCLREHNTESTPIDMSADALRTIDYTFDELIYSNPGKGLVVGLEVIKNNTPTKNSPIGMNTQGDRYAEALVRYYAQILETEEYLRKDFRAKYGTHVKIPLSPKFHALVVEAMGMTNFQYTKAGNNPDANKQPLTLLYRRERNDEYFLRIIIEYEVTPDVGDKFSNSSGCKGVVCKISEDRKVFSDKKDRHNRPMFKIVDDEEMPIREDGLRAKMVIDTGPNFNRMIFGQYYEHYITSVQYEVTKKVIHGLGLCASIHENDFSNRKIATIEELKKIDPTIFSKQYSYLMSFYEVINPEYADYFKNLPLNKQYEHIHYVNSEGIARIVFTTEHKESCALIIQKLDALFTPMHGPVKFKYGEEMITTKGPVRIGFLYMFLLDKLADEWSAIHSAHTQHFGIIASVSKRSRHAKPYRDAASRVSGETESRIYAGYAGEEVIAEMFDRVNNPETRREIQRTLLSAKKPTNIPNVVNRQNIPYGASKPIQLIKHTLSCMGIKLKYVPEQQQKE